MGTMTVYDGFQNSESAITRIGEDILKSGLFNAESPSQARILALECLARRCPPLMLAERYHLIGNKLTLKYDAMLKDFIAGGGKSKILERTGNRVAVELTNKHGDSFEFSLTWDEMLLEPTPYAMDKHQTKQMVLASLPDERNRSKLRLKDTYATPRARMQMMFARVITDAVRATDPSSTEGKYAPEEIDEAEIVTTSQDFGGLSGASTASAMSVAAQVVSAAESQKSTAYEAAVEQHLKKPTPVTEKVEAGEVVAYAPSAQVARIMLLLDAAEISYDDRQRALQRRNVSAWHSLTVEQANEIEATLQRKVDEKIAKQQAADEVAVEKASASQAREAASVPTEVASAEQSNFDQQVASEDVDAQAPADLIAALRQKIKEVDQIEPGTFDQVKVELMQKRLKLAHLTTASAREMMKHLDFRMMSDFFQSLTDARAASVVRDEPPAAKKKGDKSGN